MAVSTVANLVVELSASSQKLSADLSRSERSISSFAEGAAKKFAIIGTAVSAVTALIAGGLTSAILNSVNSLDNIGDTAQSLGIATKELQRLQFQAEQAGSSAEGIVSALGLMQNAIGEAASGNESLVKTFTSLGLNVEALKNLRPEQQFRAIADGIRNINNQSDQANIARGIFGRGGIQQLNLLRSNLDETSATFDRLGLGITESQSQNVDAFDKTKNALNAVFGNFKETVAAEAIAGFTVIGERVLDLIQKMGGLQTVATSVASGIVGGLASVSSAFDFVSDSVSFLLQTFRLGQLAVANLTLALDEYSSAARNAPTLDEIAAINAKANTPENLARSDFNPLKFKPYEGKSKEEYAAEFALRRQEIDQINELFTATEANRGGKSGVTSALEEIQSRLKATGDEAKATKQVLDDLTSNAMANLSAPNPSMTSPTKTGGGYGIITDSATGQTYTTGNVPNGSGPQNINITVSTNDAFLDVVKDTVTKTVTEAAVVDPAKFGR